MKNENLAPRGRDGSAEVRLGRAVRALREARGWSQGQLATQLTRARQSARPSEIPQRRYTQSQIAKIETAGRPTVLDEAVWLANIFGSSLEGLIAHDDDPDLAAEMVQVQELLADLDRQIADLRAQRAVAMDRLHELQGAAESLATYTRDIEDLAENGRLRLEWEEAKELGISVEALREAKARGIDSQA